MTLQSLVLAVTLLSLSASAHSAITCAFQARGLSLSFGTLNPSSGATVTVPVAAAVLNANKVGNCTPTNLTMTIVADNGLWYSGGHRLKNTASADYIAYSLPGLPLTVAKPGNVYVTFTFSGTVAGSAYADAPAGSYSDTVMILVSP